MLYANLRRGSTGAAEFFMRRLFSSGRAVEQLQSVQRPATRLHEKLRRTDVQDRISDMHEILREEIVRWDDTQQAGICIQEKDGERCCLRSG
jgi:hypothetical protein